MKIGLVSLGCPKNLVDSEVMLSLLTNKNMTLTNKPEEADVIIVNTCGFIESAKEESINAILQMGEYKSTGKCRYLLVSGCLAQRYANELFAEMPEIDALIGTACYEEIDRILDKVLAGERVISLVPSKPEEEKNKKITRFITTPAHTAYLKIAEGCDNYCSYCIIPKLRGPYKSRPFEEIMEEAKALVAGGVKELILVAQDTTLYGQDLDGRLRLPELLGALNALPDLHWIRVLYCYPKNFTDELIDAFAKYDKVCKYIDLPLQHVSDDLLKRMNRHDSKAQIENLLSKLRARIAGVNIRTTFIVGFPGETEEDFAILKEFVGDGKFDCAGVFTYSREEGTAAALMAKQIDEQVKQERYHELMAIQAGVSEKIHIDLEEEVFEVLIEGFDSENKNIAIGRSFREAPEIDGIIYVENAPHVHVGDFVKVKISQGFTYELAGELQ